MPAKPVVLLLNVFPFSLYYKVSWHSSYLRTGISFKLIFWSVNKCAQRCIRAAWSLEFYLVVHELGVLDRVFILWAQNKHLLISYLVLLCIEQWEWPSSNPRQCPIVFFLLGSGYCYLFIGSSSLFPGVPLRQESALYFSGNCCGRKKLLKCGVSFCPGIPVISIHCSLGLGTCWYQCSQVIFNSCQEIFISKCPRNCLFYPVQSHDHLEARK